MSDKITLTAELREDVGKGASRRLRRLGNKIPAIIYGGENSPQNLTMAVNEVNKAMEQEAFYSQILDVMVEGAAQQAVVRDMQRDPASNKVQHIDFQRISANRIMTVSVPLHFINEDTCVGVKLGSGTIMHNMSEVEVSCLPRHLPEYLEVDLAEVEEGSSVHLSEIALPEGVTIVALTYGEDRDVAVASVIVPRGASEEEEAEAAAAADEASAASEDAAGDEGDSDDS